MSAVAAQVLGEPFRTFELRRGPRRPETLDAGLAEIITQSRDQRRLRTDDDQLDALVATKRDDDVVIGRIDRDALGDLGNSGITGRAVELGQQRACAQRPGERVLAAARADEEDIHQVACCNSCFGVASNAKQTSRSNKTASH